MTFRSCRTLNSRSLWRKWFSGRSSSRAGVSTSRNVASWSTLTRHTWSSGHRSGALAYALLSLSTDGAKLLEAPIGTEPFRTDFVEFRASKACASVPALEHLSSSATWTIVRYCVNERLNYLAQVMDFSSSKTHSRAWTRLSITPFSALGGSPHHAHYPLPPH